MGRVRAVSRPTYRPADLAILDQLATGPLTGEEIAARIRQEALDAWLEKSNYDFEWGTAQEPLGARLLAISEARDRGLLVHGFELYPRLRLLERRGDVQRIQIEGRRPILWRRTLDIRRCYRVGSHAPHEVRWPERCLCPGE